MLAEAALNIGKRSDTTISWVLSMDFEKEEGDGMRSIWVPSMFDAFKTNTEEGVAELSDIAEVECARTSEARRSPPDTSSLGL